MHISKGRAEGSESENRSATFTGVVWADPVLPTSDGVTVNNVFFQPGARTYWHRHEHGQVLYVTSGQGKVCSRGGGTETIGVGDVVHVPAGEEHWHGADDKTYMVHFAVSLGATEWLDEVTEDEYRS